MPEALTERAAMLEGILTQLATGGSPDEHTYKLLRAELIADPAIRDLLPDFVRTHRSLSAFLPYIKQRAGTYAERRNIISLAFTPLQDHLEGRTSAPGDKSSSKVLERFDADGVHAVWAKAMSRRLSDPEGAITVARTLLETVSKRIIEETGGSYNEKDDLPKLYSTAASALNLAPSQHTEEPIKAILGGAMNLVYGLGTLRNRLSDAHGRGGKGVKPSARHASLAVNTAGAIATFLVETFHEKTGRE